VLPHNRNSIFIVFDAQVNIQYMMIAYYSKTCNQTGTLQKRKRVIEVMKRLFFEANYPFEMNS